MRSLFRAMVVLALSPYAWSGALAAEDADPSLASEDDRERRLNAERLAEIVERVRENERRYADIDFTVRKSYRLLGARDLAGDTLFADEIQRFVYQGKRFFIHRSEHSQTCGGQPQSSSTRAACDGHRTVSVWEGMYDRHESSATIWDSRIPHTALYPHTIVELDNFARGKLSETLTRTTTRFDRLVAVRYVGEADVDGLRCETIASEYFERTHGNEPQRMGAVHVWLAVDRNYLPVRRENESQTWEFHVTDWYEVAPGIWFPRRIVDTGYEFDAGRRVVKNVTEYEVLRSVLAPNYPHRFFQSVHIPFDAPVTEIHDGQVVRRYYEEARYPPETSDLTIQGTATDERLVASMRGIRDLRRLNLHGSPISDAGLVVLTQAPELRYLELSGTSISDVGLQHLRHVPHLEHLGLSNTHITDRGLALLGHLSSLEHLDLDRCEPITGKGLASLSKLKCLSSLRLRECRQLTDQDIALLAGCAALRSLDLKGCADVTEDGIESLRKSLPECRIGH